MSPVQGMKIGPKIRPQVDQDYGGFPCMYTVQDVTWINMPIFWWCVICNDLKVIPDSYGAKRTKICNLWPVIQPINHLFKIRQKAFLGALGKKGFLSDLEKMVYDMNYMKIC